MESWMKRPLGGGQEHGNELLGYAFPDRTREPIFGWIWIWGPGLCVTLSHEDFPLNMLKHPLKYRDYTGGKSFKPCSYLQQLPKSAEHRAFRSGLTTPIVGF